jgi:hypothetical protein
MLVAYTAVQAGVAEKQGSPAGYFLFIFQVVKEEE